MTRNKEARALIDKAWETCSGCRTKWRIKPGTSHHVVAGETIYCWAIEQRRELQDLIELQDLKEIAK